MKVKTEIGIKWVKAEGEEAIRTVPEDVQIVDGNTEDLSSMAELASRHAQSCIYCGSTDQLSSEHIVPYAWGGTVQIHNGSCEVCRLITSGFENYALNDGAMAHVRKAIGLPSRSNHRSGMGPIDMTMEGRDGQALTIEAGTDTPAILGFPLFVRPGLLIGDVSTERFAKFHSWGQEPGDMANPFARSLRRGALISAIRVIHCGDEDDNLLEFRFGPPDPTVSPFRQTNHSGGAGARTGEVG